MAEEKKFVPFVSAETKMAEFTFRAVFLGVLMKAMRSTVGNGGLFKNGADSQTYRDMFDQEIARSMARAGGIGLGQMVLRDQLRRQAAAESDEAKKTSQVLSPGDR
mgnify:CR=1 FL=1